VNIDFDAIVKVVELAIIPYCTWVVKTLLEVRGECRSVKEALIGLDGKNGLRSRVEKIEYWIIGATRKEHE
jgi:hypothetical protein